MPSPRVAIVHDWLTNMGGAEKVVLALHRAFPDAPIYTSVFDPKACPEFAKLDVRTTYLQKMPARLRARHQLFPLLRANAFRRLNLNEYDVVISSASAEAKAVRVRKGAVHICYCHTPTRYYWSHYKDYLSEPGFGPLNTAVRVALPALVHFMRRSDLKAAKGVDHFIANSKNVAERIKQYYKRESTVIHPSVDMRRFRNIKIDGPRKGFVTVGRQVPYKRFDLAVAACTKLGLPLMVYGEGPEHERLTRMAGPTVNFVVGASDEQVVQALAKAEAFIFAQEEDFGITQLEAMAAGTPVIAYAKGGALETVKNGETGLFFKTQNVDSLVKVLQQFSEQKFSPNEIQKYAEEFSEEQFVAEMLKLIKEKRLE